MKKTLSLFLALVMVLCLAIAPALGEQSTKSAFEPFENPVKVKVVVGYSEADIPSSGALPSQCLWNDIVKEYLNVEFDWLWEVPSTQYNTKLDLSLASGQYPDILKCDFNTYCYLKDSGMLADLTDVWNEYASDALKETFSQYLYFNTDENGELLAIPYASNPASNVQCNFWRTDWLKNLGMELPTTLDEFTTVVKAFRDNDPDGNGEKDTYGLSFYSDPFGVDISMMPIFNAFGSYPNAWIEKDGKIVRGAIQPETKEALDYLRELYAGGYIDPEFATYSQDQLKVDVANGKIGQYGAMWYMPDYGTVIDSMINDEKATWSAAAMPGKTADAPAAMCCPEKIAGSFNVVLKTASEEAKIAMIKLLNLFYEWQFPSGTIQFAYNTLDHDTDEWKAMSARHYGWWMPVNIWHPGSNYAKVDLVDNYMATGEWDLTIYNETNQKFWTDKLDLLKNGRAACTTDDEIKAYATAWAYAVTRFNSEYAGTCSLTICDNLVKNGNTVANVYYGSETDTGIAVATTLNDMVVQYICRYVMGLENEDSFDTFVENWNAMGGATWTEEVNAAYAATH